jgi:hypothetical protein
MVGENLKPKLVIIKDNSRIIFDMALEISKQQTHILLERINMDKK